MKKKQKIMIMAGCLVLIAIICMVGFGGGWTEAAPPVIHSEPASHSGTGPAASVPVEAAPETVAAKSIADSSSESGIRSGANTQGGVRPENTGGTANDTPASAPAPSAPLPTPAAPLAVTPAPAEAPPTAGEPTPDPQPVPALPPAPASVPPPQPQPEPEPQPAPAPAPAPEPAPAPQPTPAPTPEPQPEQPAHQGGYAYCSCGAVLTLEELAEHMKQHALNGESHHYDTY